jgi:small-conductance mechanosensitive channel
MPLLFLERMEEKEMPTLQEVKNQMDKVRNQLEIFDRFDEEIEKAEKEVKAIKSKNADVQTFEDFQAINAKEKYIADMKAQRTKLEKERIDSIVADARKIDAPGYLETALEQDETVKRQRQEIKQKSIELLELIANYNENYKNTAKRLADEVRETGIEELFNRLNTSPEYSGASKPYISSGVTGYMGNQYRYLDPKADLAFFVNRVNHFEGE